MTIKRHKNWLFQNYFIPGITIYGMTCAKYIYPVESANDLKKKLFICLLTIVLSGIVVKLLGNVIGKSLTADDKWLVIKGCLALHKYDYSCIQDVKYEKLKRTRSGRYGSRLSFTAGKKKYVFDSTEFDNLDKFVRCLQKQVQITIS